MGRAGPRLASACSQQAHVVGLSFHKGRNPLVREAWPGSQHGRPSRASGWTQTGGEKLRAKQEACGTSRAAVTAHPPQRGFFGDPVVSRVTQTAPEGQDPASLLGLGVP